MNAMIRIWLACIVLLTAPDGSGQAKQAPAQPQFEQRLGERLPLELEYTDETGQTLRLAQLFGDKPVVLVPGYFHCPQLCSTVLESVMQSLIASGIPGRDYRLLALSIDPRETPVLAARKKSAYAPMLAREGIDLRLLTGSAASIDALAESAGFHYVYDPAANEYRHPAGFLVATADGRISRYFFGAGFDPGQVRQALGAARGGNIGSLAERLLLACAHYDPQTGRYSLTAMTAMRLFMLAVLLLMLAGWWRLRRRETHHGR